MSNNFLQNITTAELAALVNLKPFDEDVFVQSLYADINKAIKHIEKTADKYYSDDEDKITNLLVLFLKGVGYSASGQTKSNGSVDITVQDRDQSFTWLAEAKRGNSYNGVFEGMLQLVTRYISDEKHAGFFIYHQKLDSLSYFKNWFSYLSSGDFEKYKAISDRLDECRYHFKKSPIANAFTGDECYFDYNIVSKKGKEVKVRNFILSLHYNPADKSGRENKSLKVGQAKIYVNEVCDKWFREQEPPENIDKFMNSLQLVFPELFE